MEETSGGNSQRLFSLCELRELVFRSWGKWLLGLTVDLGCSDVEEDDALSVILKETDTRALSTTLNIGLTGVR